MCRYGISSGLCLHGAEAHYVPVQRDPPKSENVGISTDVLFLCAGGGFFVRRALLFARRVI